MEHIVQFAISVDDERIKEICEETAAKQVITDIEKFSYGTDWSGKVKKTNTPEKLKDMFEEEISKFIKAHADHIIDLAVTKLAANMLKTKKVQEALDTAIQEATDDTNDILKKIAEAGEETT